MSPHAMNQAVATRIGELEFTHGELVRGGRAYLAAPDGGPDWGLRLGLTLIHPK